MMMMTMMNINTYTNTYTPHTHAYTQLDGQKGSKNLQQQSIIRASYTRQEEMFKRLYIATI